MTNILEKRRESALAWGDCERAFLNWSRCDTPETAATLEHAKGFAWDCREMLEAVSAPEHLDLLPDQGRGLIVPTRAGEAAARFLFEDEETGTSYVVAWDEDGARYDVLARSEEG